MAVLHRRLVRQMREQAARGERPSRIVRRLEAALPVAERHRVLLIDYLREAFGLPLGEVAALSAWCPDGEGELDDAGLDALLQPAIDLCRHQWYPEGDDPAEGDPAGR